MKTSESIQQGNLEQEGFESAVEKPASNFWGIALMVLVFVIVIAALALLLL
jgi:hypothetical protein